MSKNEENGTPRGDLGDQGDCLSLDYSERANGGVHKVIVDLVSPSVDRSFNNRSMSGELERAQWFRDR
jgi:hypothetical protein